MISFTTVVVTFSTGKYFYIKSNLKVGLEQIFRWVVYSFSKPVVNVRNFKHFLDFT